MKDERNLWQSTAGVPIEPLPLDGEVFTEAVVIGAGYTGCAAALALAEAGVAVRVLEAHTVGHGGSGRNVGLVNAGLWLPPETVEASLGGAPGRRLNELLALAPARVFDLVAAHAIDCEATRSGTLHCAHSPRGFAELAERARQLLARGADVELLDSAGAARMTGARGLHGALFDRRAGTVQPLAYCRGLARAAVAAGARFHQHAAVDSVSHRDGRWRVTSAGATVVADALLLATNAYHQGFASEFSARVVPVHFFQCATAPIAADLRAAILPGGQGCWDTAPVMSSFRLDAAGRLILGAVGSLASLGAPIHRDWARRKLAELFPALADQAFEYGWHGRIGMTTDHLPRVVEIGPRALAVYGYSGRGIGPGTVFGEAAANWLMSGDGGVLPVAPGRHAGGLLDPVKALYYECGVTLWHLAAARRWRRS